MPAYDRTLFEPPAPVAKVTLRDPISGKKLSDVPMSPSPAATRPSAVSHAESTTRSAWSLQRSDPDHQIGR